MQKSFFLCCFVCYLIMMSCGNQVLEDEISEKPDAEISEKPDTEIPEKYEYVKEKVLIPAIKAIVVNLEQRCNKPLSDTRKKEISSYLQKAYDTVVKTHGREITEAQMKNYVEGDDFEKVLINDFPCPT